MNKFYSQFKKLEHSYVPLKEDSTIQDIVDTYKLCNICSLKCTDKCFGYGNLSPMIMFVGFSPSSYEITNKKPFTDNMNIKLVNYVQYLNNYISLKNNVYYTNLILCDIHNSKGANNCNDRINHEIKEINPKYIILLGSNVVKEVFGQNVSIDNTRLKTHSIKFSNKYFKVFTTYSPKEYVLDKDKYGDKIKNDLKFIVEEILDDRKSNEGLSG